MIRLASPRLAQSRAAGNPSVSHGTLGLVPRSGLPSALAMDAKALSKDNRFSIEAVTGIKLGAK
jgi:hypothetical protein